MKFRHILTVAFVAAAPLAAQSTQTPTQGPTRGMGRGGVQRMLADLNLTDAQTAQVKAIQEKYQEQMRTAFEAGRADFQAAREAREKGDTVAARAAMQRSMEKMRPIREAQQKEIRAILTAEQQAKFDAKLAEQQARVRQMGFHGKKGKHAGRHQRRATHQQS